MHLQQCGNAWVSSSHQTIVVCDDLRDGVGPFVEYVRTDGIGHRMRDKNGAKAGCGKRTNKRAVVKWRMCMNWGSYNTCTKKWASA
jgi:hypothetical protein